MFRISTQQNKKKKSPIFPQISDPSNEHSQAQPLKSPKTIHFASNKTPKKAESSSTVLAAPPRGRSKGVREADITTKCHRNQTTKTAAGSAHFKQNTPTTPIHTSPRTPTPAPKRNTPAGDAASPDLPTKGGAGARRARAWGRRRPMALEKREIGWWWWWCGEERACCARLWVGSGLGGGRWHLL